MHFVLEFLVANLWFYYYILEAIVLFFIPASWRSKNVKGQIVLITGAGSGLGRLMAHRFAWLGCRLVLWDIDNEGNKETADDVQERHADVYTYTCDLSDSDSVYRIANQVKAEVGDVDILINNAGIVTGRQILQCSDAMMKKTMEVNSMAHFWTVKAFLPAMLAKNRGHVVTVASAAGFLGSNTMADYCASKFAAVGFHESLLAELRVMKKFGVKTTVVCPYLIDTGMFDGAKPGIPSLVPELCQDYVADKIVEAVLTDQAILCLPRAMYFVPFLKSLLPVKAGLVANDLLRTNSLMDTFRGRSKHE